MVHKKTLVYRMTGYSVAEIRMRIDSSLPTGQCPEGTEAAGGRPGDV